MSVVIVGVTGSVAAYRAADICRELMRNGFTVKVCMSRSAEGFVTRSLFEALTGFPVLTDVFDEPVRGRMAHIDWAREADCILVCPASANAIATIASGQAEDMFTTLVTASSAPLVIAPAMNPEMYASASNRANMEVLASRGAIFVEPDEGDVACGEQGQGKLASVERIVKAAKEAAFRSNQFAGKRVVITSGPTREPIDPVRYITNRSSGKMGFALARAALQMGAEVTVVSGPTHEINPPKCRLIRVESADEMLSATLQECQTAHLLVGAAAVADFKAKAAASQKIKDKSGIALELVPNPDILKEVRAKFGKLPIIGFAAETGAHVDNALHKLRDKGLQAIVLNDVSQNAIGFDSEMNAGVMLTAEGNRIDLPQESKFNMAIRILSEAATFLQ